MSTTNTILTILAIVILGAAWGFSEKAEADAYVEPSVFTLDTDAGDFRGVNLTGGIQFTENFGVRGSWMVSAGDETYQDVSISLEQMYGGDLVFTLPVTDSASVYGFMGQTWMKAKGSYNGYSATAKDDFTTFGGGLKFAVRESFSLFGEVKNIDGDTLLSAGLRFEL